MTQPPQQDPRWHWNGQQWLWWNGREWVVAPQPAAPAAKAGTPRRGLSTAAIVGIVLAAVLVGGVVVAGMLAGRPVASTAGPPSVKASPTSTPVIRSTTPAPTPSATRTTAKATPTPIATKWYPKGYSEVQDGIAFAWIPNKKVSCPTYTTCWQAYVIARDGCPSSLYVELSVENKAGDAIGFTNDVAGTVRPGQRAKLTFISTSDEQARAALAEVSCY